MLKQRPTWRGRQTMRENQKLRPKPAWETRETVRERLRPKPGRKVYGTLKERLRTSAKHRWDRMKKKAILYTPPQVLAESVDSLGLHADSL